MKQSKEMDQLKKVQLEHLEFLEKQNEQVFYQKDFQRHRQLLQNNTAANSSPLIKLSVLSSGMERHLGKKYQQSLKGIPCFTIW